VSTGEVVALVDIGIGNLRSVERALLRASSDIGRNPTVLRTSDPEVIARADRVVVPGQGAFRDFAAAIRGGVGDALRESIKRGAPYLGICLGLQALFAASEEATDAEGLGVFAGKVVRLPDGAKDPSTFAAVKIPHMGWNQIALCGAGRGALSVFDAAPPYVYFVHSFHAVPTDASLIAATAQHGPFTVTAAIQRDNVLATQFHPEKSQRAGLTLLGAFLGSR
jgi:glutamine amidotransferase